MPIQIVDEGEPEEQNEHPPIVPIEGSENKPDNQKEKNESNPNIFWHDVTPMEILRSHPPKTSLVSFALMVAQQFQLPTSA